MTRLLNGVGLGTFPFANPFTPVPEASAIALIEEYLRRGGKYFDTSPTYAFGAVEEMLGRALRGHRREDFFISTSCGYVRDGDAYRVSGRYEDVVRDCDESLERLGLDFLDIYMSHIPDPETPFAETMGALADLRRAGKVRAIAVSNVTLEQLRQYDASGDVEFVQNRFSLMNRSLSPEFIDYCQANEIGIVAYQVIERGLLTSASKTGSRAYRDGDLRLRKPEFADLVRSRLATWVQRALEPIAADYATSVTAVVIAWMLKQPEIVLAQMGATSLDQLVENLAGASLELTPDALTQIDAAYAELAEEIEEEEGRSVRAFMGLEDYDLYSGSASGR